MRLSEAQRAVAGPLHVDVSTREGSGQRAGRGASEVNLPSREVVPEQVQPLYKSCLIKEVKTTAWKPYDSR